MTDRCFTLPTSANQVFPGGAIDGIRLYHDDIVIDTDDQGVHIRIPDTVDADTIEEAAFHITEVHGFLEES